MVHRDKTGRAVWRMIAGTDCDHIALATIPRLSLCGRDMRGRAVALAGSGDPVCWVCACKAKSMGMTGGDNEE